MSPIAADAPRERPGAGLPEQQGPTLKEGEEAVLVEPGPADPDDLYVSCVPEKGVVTRYGGASVAYIGAKRGKDGIEFQPDAVVLIPGADVRRFSREYRRVLAEGALKVTTREAFVAYRVKRADELRAAKQERERKRAELAEQAQEPTKPSTPVALDAAGSAASDAAGSPTSGD